MSSSSYNSPAAAGSSTLAAEVVGAAGASLAATGVSVVVAEVMLVTEAKMLVREHVWTATMLTYLVLELPEQWW